MTHTVVGLFEDRSHAQAAMNELVAAGFVKENIDISNRRVANTAGATEYNADYDAGEGEGLGDRIANFFNSLFDDDEPAARTYTDAASEADAILTVQVDSEDRAEKARYIFDRHDAMDVDERGARRYGATTDTTKSRSDRTTDRKTMPVVEENLKVGKREVERCGARVRSRIINHPVEENVRLREEHVVVNRRPVDREITDADLKNFRPGEMELTERAEVPVVGKQARVVEEVEVGKNVTEREEPVRDTVRSTEVDVEKFDQNEAVSKKAKRAKR